MKHGGLNAFKMDTLLASAMTGGLTLSRHKISKEKLRTIGKDLEEDLELARQPRQNI